jgi:hypothetical protein
MYRRYAADKKNKNNSLNKCMVTGKTNSVRNNIARK